MAIPWTRVTWYSQALAIVLFVATLALGFWLGAQYGEAVGGQAFNDVGETLIASPAALSGMYPHSIKSSFPFFSWGRGAQSPSTSGSTGKTTSSSSSVATSSYPSSSSTSSTTGSVTNPLSGSQSSNTGSTQPPSTSVPPTQPAQNASQEIRFTAYLTAYTYWDNTPPGSSEISNPIIHQVAGGTGTFSDPITVAVGHSISGRTDTLDYPAGTKFYLPYLRKYFIVEDTCGDGNTPQNGPCHTGYQGHPWLDLWLDGANGTRASSDDCASDITDLHTIIENPAPNYLVVPGPIYSTSCATQYSDTAVTQ
ncbi:MAG TPA: hypothetical protein VG753_00460 [Candidatus Paceibacterota bacterium]|nr:hypothetical protein [Candidatus Paceibacterota bacterium]